MWDKACSGGISELEHAVTFAGCRKQEGMTVTFFPESTCRAYAAQEEKVDFLQRIRPTAMGTTDCV